LDSNLSKFRARQLNVVLGAAQADGLSGLVRTVNVMVDPNGPSAECIQEADDAFASAANAEQVWDAAIGMASCLRLAPIFELPDPPDPPEPPKPPPDLGAGCIADVVLAVLLVHLRADGKGLGT
jgi:hypothetical protein